MLIRAIKGSRKIGKNNPITTHSPIPGIPIRNIEFIVITLVVVKDNFNDTNTKNQYLDFELIKNPSLNRDLKDIEF
jgi:hypothetical protein